MACGDKLVGCFREAAKISKLTKSTTNVFVMVNSLNFDIYIE